jgi:hypothetical protein
MLVIIREDDEAVSRETARPVVDRLLEKPSPEAA